MPVIPESNTYSVPISATRIIKRALRILGSVSSGEEPSADETADAKEALNGMLDTWNSEEFMVPAMTPQTFSLTSGAQSYTIGPECDFNCPRPAQIIQGQAMVKRGSVEYPLKVCTRAEWASIRLKEIVTAIPSQIFYDNETPNGTIYFFPIPGADEFCLYTPNLLKQIQDVGEIFYLPPAYYEALTWGLALELWGEYPNPPLLTYVAEMAAAKKAAAKRQNIQLDPLKCELADLNMPDGWVDSSAFARGF